METPEIVTLMLAVVTFAALASNATKVLYHADVPRLLTASSCVFSRSWLLLSMVMVMRTRVLSVPCELCSWRCSATAAARRRMLVPLLFTASLYANSTTAPFGSSCTLVMATASTVEDTRVAKSALSARPTAGWVAKMAARLTSPGVDTSTLTAAETPVAARDGDGRTVRVLLPVLELVAVMLLVAVAELVLLPVDVTLCVAVLLADAEAVAVAVAVSLPVVDGVGVWDGVTDDDGVPLAVCDIDGVREDVTDGDAPLLRDDVGVGVAVLDGDALGVLLALGTQGASWEMPYASRGSALWNVTNPSVPTLNAAVALLVPPSASVKETVTACVPGQSRLEMMTAAAPTCGLVALTSGVSTGAPAAAPGKASVTTGGRAAYMYDVDQVHVSGVASTSYAEEASRIAWNVGIRRGAQSRETLMREGDRVTLRRGIIGAVCRLMLMDVVDEAPRVSITVTAAV